MTQSPKSAVEPHTPGADKADVQPGVRFTPYRGPIPEEERARVRATDLYKAGDTVLVWANEGDLYMSHLRQPKPRPSGRVEIAHDGFVGTIVGHYVTREGKRGVVVQQDGTRVVHVYGERWLQPAPTSDDTP